MQLLGGGVKAEIAREWGEGKLDRLVWMTGEQQYQLGGCDVRCDWNRGGMCSKRLQQQGIRTAANS
jgi:hypothetical protein